MVIAPIAPPTEQDHPDLVAARRDHALVAAHRRGDGEAFAAIVGTYHAMLLHQARRQLGDPQDAEDAVQETLLRAYRGLDGFGTGGDWRLGAWLTRIMANVCTDQRRRRAASSALAVRLGPGTYSSGDAGELASDPVALAAVTTALRRLPATQRQAFVLRAVDDLSFADIADQLGISEDNARARVQRARTALRHALDNSVATALAAVPLAVAGAWRASLRSVLRPLAHRLPGETPAGSRVLAPGLSAGPVATGTARAAAGAPGVVAGSSSSILATGSQLVNQVAGQVAASPAGQLLMSTASATSGSGGGRSALVLGLAASVATAGALTLPPAAAPPAHRSAPRAQVAAPIVAPTGSSTSSSVSSPSASSSESAVATDPGPGTGTASGGGAGSDPTAGTTSLGSTATTAVTPAWVLAATALAGKATTTPGTGTTPGSGAGSSSGSGSAISGTGGSGSATSGSGSSGSATSGSTTSTAKASVLPAGSCASVAGFPGVTTDTNVAPIGSATVQRTLDTGTVNLAAIGPDPSFGTDVPLTANGVDETGPLQVAVGACLATAGSTLAVDLTGTAGTEVQLVGSLLSATPTDASTPSAGATYLFAGTVNPYAGISVDGSLPWGLPDQFVAELQVAEPANTAELTVAFMLPDGGTINPDPTTVGNPSGASSPTTTGESTSGGTTGSGTTGTGTTETGSVASDVPGASSTSSDSSPNTGSGATSGSSSDATTTSNSGSQGGAGSAG